MFLSSIILMNYSAFFNIFFYPFYKCSDCPQPTIKRKIALRRGSEIGRSEQEPFRMQVQVARYFIEQ
jgi:hypothetical protein